MLQVEGSARFEWLTVPGDIVLAALAPHATQVLRPALSNQLTDHRLSLVADRRTQCVIVCSGTLAASTEIKPALGAPRRATALGSGCLIPLFFIAVDVG